MYIHVSYSLGYDIKEHSLKLTSREGNCIRTGPRTPLLYCARCTADRAQCVDMMKKYSLCAVYRYRVGMSYSLHMMSALWTTRTLRVWLRLVDIRTLTLTLTTLYDNFSTCQILTQQMPLPQTFNTSSVSVWFEAECVSWLVTVKKTTISSDLVVTLVWGRNLWWCSKSNMTHRPRLRCVKSADHPY
jgi:hypothetical protein